MDNGENLMLLKRLIHFALWAGAVFFIGYAFLGHAIISDAYRGQSWNLLNRVIEHQNERPLGFYITKADFVMFFLANFWLTAVLFLQRLVQKSSAGERTVFDALMFVEYACLFYFYLARMGAEHDWYVLEQIMTFTGDPPYQHRILFVVPAQILRKVMPSVSYLQSFLWSQAAAIVLALWAVKRFARLFIREDLAFVAQFLLVAMWAPTLDYFTFYDIGIVFVYSFCLYHLLRREFVPYLLMFALGTFNHELTLFLVVASAFVLFGRMDMRKLAEFLLLQLVLYALVRGSLFHFLPVDRAWASGRVLFNLDLFSKRPRFLFMSIAPLIFWYALALPGLRPARPDLRRCLIVLPCLLAMTLLVGQLNESRQFDAFIPIAVALILGWIAARAGVPSTEKATS